MENESDIRIETLFLKARAEVKRIGEASFQFSQLEKKHYSTLSLKDKVELLKWYVSLASDMADVSSNLYKIKKQYEGGESTK